MLSWIMNKENECKQIITYAKHFEDGVRQQNFIDSLALVIFMEYKVPLTNCKLELEYYWSG